MLLFTKEKPQPRTAEQYTDVDVVDALVAIATLGTVLLLCELIFQSASKPEIILVPVFIKTDLPLPSETAAS